MAKNQLYRSLEDKLLRYCAQNDTTNRIKDSLKKILYDNLNWSYILQESIKEGIACLLYNQLSNFEYGSIPEDVWRNLKEVYYLNTYRNIKIYNELENILSSFNNKGLKVIPLKGVFLLEKIYNNIALRGMTDIDLLIKKEDLSRIDNVLGDLGYRTPIDKRLLSLAVEKSYLNSIDYFGSEDRMPSLHIHWHIVNINLPTYIYAKNIKMDAFWKCATPTRLSGVETLQLAPHHLVMYLAEHALKHSFDRLILLTDLNEVIKKYGEKIDWEMLIRETKEFGMERQLFYSLFFTNQFLDAKIPQDILSELRPRKTGLLEKRFFQSILGNNRSSNLSYFAYLGMIRGNIDKTRFIFRTLFPPPSVLALTYNIDGPNVTIKDYLLFLREQLSHLKGCLKV